MTNDSIRITCAGSGWPINPDDTCRMCGQVVPVSTRRDRLVAAWHQYDAPAMLDPDYDR